MLLFHLLVLAFVLYRLFKVLYNLYLHPLRSFPGPKLAAASHVYEFYWSIFRDGEFVWQIERLHEQYGPIVRITPRELHISDPSFYDEIYAGNPKRVEADYRFAKFTGVPKSMPAATSHDLHQARRNSLIKFFSKRSIAKIHPMIQEKIELVINKLGEASESRGGDPVNLDRLFSAFTADTTSQYLFSRSMDCLKSGENQFADASATAFAIGQWLKFLPPVLSYAKKIPPSWVDKISPMTAILLRSHATIRTIALEVLNAPECAPLESHETLFAAIMDPRKPEEERTVARIEDEGFAVMAAGTHTSSWALSVAMFHLLDNPEVFRKLRNQLLELWPEPTEPPELSVLENMPLLKGVVNESIRLSMGTIGRSPRIAPDRVLQYKDWTIPVGTPCSTVTYFVHTNPEIFPEPWTYDPYRWIRAAEQGHHLERHIASFLKGVRSCIGINLATAEIYMMIANLVRRTTMKLHETTTVDCVTPFREHFIVIPKDTSGVRVHVVDAA